MWTCRSLPRRQQPSVSMDSTRLWATVQLRKNLPRPGRSKLGVWQCLHREGPEHWQD
ncbi:hypothetical protein B0T26DRAFT_719879 [Lasiosphaeria miniovina]|uniref:Uncharacterized protein n=1 Tax=Lasiosphaeria miniovina TaxID=1954250 RepID=A0AA40AE70_9PEZI|nr:uncharacterized protein B0T26DRAFT_719879 [Lasiosphaeria miniovina]KAK0714203.1 hypothetical protein B0T26DRAFT_719879 [Lasiosphaeria miniovina]